jgi:hypothetical protein
MRPCDFNQTPITALPNLSGTESDNIPGSPWNDISGRFGNEYAPVAFGIIKGEGSMPDSQKAES